MADNSGSDLNVADLSPKSRSPLAKLGCAASAIVVILLLVALLLPARRSAREVARRGNCMNNLKNIAIAIHLYESDFGHLPPAYTVDAEGNRLHSWRTLILPYMEEKRLYETIDLTKPWDDPANAVARETIMFPFLCASAPYDDQHLTTYLAIVGPDCAFSGSVPRKMSEVKDGSMYSMSVVDAPPDRAVHWMSPYDVRDGELLAYGPESKTNHIGILHAVFLDSHIATVPLDIDREKLRAMLTIAGGEKVED